MMYNKKETLTYTISEQFPQGKAELILYAFPSDGGIIYYFAHDQINRHCGSFAVAITMAQAEWEREKEGLIIIEFKPELSEEERAEIPF